MGVCSEMDLMKSPGGTNNISQQLTAVVQHFAALRDTRRHVVIVSAVSSCDTDHCSPADTEMHDNKNFLKHMPKHSLLRAVMPQLVLILQNF